MPVSFNTKGDTLTARIKGDVDHHTSASLRDSIDEAVLCSSPRVLCLDFSEVTFMDSSGVGLVMGRYKTVKGCGGELEIENLSLREKRIMRLSGIEKIATIKGEDGYGKDR